ncbi:unnamed protein product [Commensalibacter communis]|uniref:GIY-YIG nuclease family protein n=1 Tax=Commensalibacter communis TaxID=2972786 RepID=UPI0022FFAC8F|nr:GIY-YIG nuclease family protein [Commensalibacter communis]CAI3956323.1 unnamed protein product [Commensalibacter communis]
MVQNQDANKDWFYALSSISAVYLICDNSNGKQYIGSAYGNKGGLWKRWTDYVYTKHGGNKQLKTIYEQNENQHLNFTFSILLILPKGMSSEEVCRYENLYKEKLGSRVYGLNSN